MESKTQEAKKDIQLQPPFRVGRKQRRAVLDANGIEVGVFRTGSEEGAQKFCDWLNKAYEHPQANTGEREEERAEETVGEKQSLREQLWYAIDAAFTGIDNSNFDRSRIDFAAGNCERVFQSQSSQQEKTTKQTVKGEDNVEAAEKYADDHMDKFDYSDGKGNIDRYNNRHVIEECYLHAFEQGSQQSEARIKEAINILKETLDYLPTQNTNIKSRVERFLSKLK